MAPNAGQKSTARRFSMAKSNSISHPLPANEDTVDDVVSNYNFLRKMSWKKNPDIFGSVISLVDDESVS